MFTFLYTQSNIARILIRTNVTVMDVFIDEKSECAVKRLVAMSVHVSCAWPCAPEELCKGARVRVDGRAVTVNTFSSRRSLTLFERHGDGQRPDRIVRTSSYVHSAGRDVLHPAMTTFSQADAITSLVVAPTLQPLPHQPSLIFPNNAPLPSTTCRSRRPIARDGAWRTA